MSGSHRFNDTSYLEAWQRLCHYPAIHSAIVDAARRHFVRTDSTLDLCCSTGLLGQQLLGFGFERVTGVDADEKAIANGRAHGISLPMTHMTINVEHPGNLLAHLTTHGVTQIVARRCIPELYSTCPKDGVWTNFVTLLQKVGVQRILLQGRVFSARATHPLACVESEAMLFAQSYRIVSAGKDMVLLEQL